MSDLDARITGPALFDITEQYTHLRYDHVEQVLERQAVLARHDYVALEDIGVHSMDARPANPPLSEGEWDISEDLLTEAIPLEEWADYSLPEESSEATPVTGELMLDADDELDEVDPVGDVMEDFDAHQADRVGKIHGYRLHNVEPGTITLGKVDWDNAGRPTTTSVKVLLAGSGKVVPSKTRYINDEIQKLEFTAEDAEALALALSRLQAMSELQPHQA